MSAIYRFGEFRLDAGKRVLSRERRPVALTPKAFDLLVVLLDNRSRLVTKEELLQAVWLDTFVEEGILKYNVSMIRKSLGDESWIETHPRRGYRFAGEVTLEEAAATTTDRTDVTVSVEAELARTKSLWPWAVLSVVILMGLGWIVSSGRAKPGNGIRALAVLPFQSISAANRELELGLTDSLIGRLGAEGHWLVRPTAAVRSYAGSDRDPVAVGRTLAVDAVLDGSIQRSEDRIRLTLQLLRVSDGKHLWTGKFEPKLTDLFALEDQIAGEVAQALRTRLTPASSIARRQSSDPEVYQLYLAGRHYFNETTPAATRQAIRSMESAIQKDPGFAPAYGMLALSYWQLSQRGGAPSRDVRDKLRDAARKAVELDDSNTEGHIALSFSKMWLDYDWAGSKHEYQRALELNPSEPLAYVAWGIHCIANGKFEETERAYRKKLEIDPHSLMSIEGMGYPLYYAGKNEEAMVWFRKALEVDPNFPVAYNDLSLVYGIQGNYEKMVESSLKAAALSGSSPERIAQRLEIFRKQGIDGYRREGLGTLLARREKGEYVSPVVIAGQHLALGEKAVALDWLERAIEERNFQVLFLKTFPPWHKLSGEKRYHDLLHKMNLE